MFEYNMFEYIDEGICMSESQINDVDEGIWSLLVA